MKKLFSMLLAVLMFSALAISCGDPDPEPTPEPTPWDDLAPTNTQWGLVINYTANWCGPCGSWGVPLMKRCVEKGNVVGVGVKASGDPQYNAPIYSAYIADRTTGGSIPAFWMGDTKTESESALTTLMNRTPKAGVAMKHELTEDSIIVYSVVETFDTFDPEGEYYLATVVQEDGLKYSQAGVTDPNYRHNYVTRAAFDGKPYGVPVTLKTGKNNFRYAIAIETKWDVANIYAHVVLYKKEGTTKPVYKFINGSWSRP